MGALNLLFLITLCHGLSIPIRYPDLPNLPAPDIRSLETSKDPISKNPYAKVTWTEVDSGDDQDPVIGYKLKVWEIQKIKITEISFDDNDEQIRMEVEVNPIISHTVTPDGESKVFITTANETTAIFPDMKLDVTYQFGVLAFTKKGEGPLSNPTRVRLYPPEKKE